MRSPQRNGIKQKREGSVMTVATFPPCRKRIAPFPSDRKCGNKAFPACGLKKVVTTSAGAPSDISMNFAAGTVSPPKVQRI